MGGHNARGVQSKTLDVGAQGFSHGPAGHGVEERRREGRGQGLGHGLGQQELLVLGLDSLVAAHARGHGDFLQAVGDFFSECFDLLVRGRRQGREDQRPVGLGRGHEKTVWNEAVKVRVQIQSPPKPLDESHRARAAVAYADRAAASAHPGKEGLKIGAHHARQKLGVVGQRQAKGPGEGEVKT